MPQPAIDHPPIVTNTPSTMARKATVAALMLAALLLLVSVLGSATVHRTQEARVLVTAREMIDAPRQGWMIPMTNGQVRLRKPPLAYWASAGSMKLSGDGIVQGRLPGALAGWGTVVITYFWGRRLFGARAGAFAAAALFGCVGFLTFARFAETDVWAMFFVTAACCAIWRAYDAQEPRPWAWLHVSAVAIAGAALVKGPPAGYPLLFLLCLAARDRRWSALGAWVKSGALVTIAVLAVPWFVYVMNHPEWSQITDDLSNSAAGGEGHGGWFFQYFPQLLLATAPWSGFAALATIAAVQRRRDARLSGLLLWIGTIFVPLCLWGNKQPHYLLPLLPPVMLLVGWLIDATISGAEDEGLRRWVRGTWWATAAVMLVALPVAVVVISSMRKGGFTPGAIAGAALFGLGCGIFIAYVKRGIAGGMAGLAVAACLAIAFVVGRWYPSLRTDDVERVAERIRGEFGPGPYAFYRGQSLVLCYYLDGTIPEIDSTRDLRRLLARTPEAIVIEVADPKRREPSPLPFAREESFRVKDREFVVRRGVNPAAADAPATQPSP